MAIDTKNKNTILEEDASIYSKRNENKKEIEKWSEMSKQERMKHFKDYYLKTVILVCLAIAAIGYMIFDAVNSYREQQLLIAVINDYLEPETNQSFSNDILEYLSLDHKKDKVVIDSDFLLSGSTSDTSLQRLTAFIYAKQLDIVIADPNTFNQYVNNGTFVDLTEHLPPELLKRCSDSLYYHTRTAGSKNLPYGIYLDQSDVYMNLGISQTKPIMGIVSNSKHMNHAIQFIEYLFKK